VRGLTESGFSVRESYVTMIRPSPAGTHEAGEGRALRRRFKSLHRTATGMLAQGVKLLPGRVFSAQFRAKRQGARSAVQGTDQGAAESRDALRLVSSSFASRSSSCGCEPAT